MWHDHMISKENKRGKAGGWGEGKISKTPNTGGS